MRVSEAPRVSKGSLHKNGPSLTVGLSDTGMKTMKTRIVLITVIILIASGFVFAQEHKMVQFQMAIMKKGPKWDATGETERNQVLHQHLRNVIGLLQSGKAVAPGDGSDPGFLFCAPLQLRAAGLMIGGYRKAFGRPICPLIFRPSTSGF
jgi:hypothetical protein